MCILRSGALTINDRSAGLSHHDRTGYNTGRGVEGLWDINPEEFLTCLYSKKKRKGKGTSSCTPVTQFSHSESSRKTQASAKF